MKFPLTIRVCGYSILMLAGLVLCRPSQSFAQTKSGLEERRTQLVKDIGLTNKLLEETQKNKSTLEEQFSGIQVKIDKRQALIQTLKEEIDFHENRIKKETDVIAALERDMGILKEEYGQMMQQALRTKLNHNTTLFILSASGVNDAFRRWIYLKEYNDYRMRQAEMIVRTQKVIENKIARLNLRKDDKSLLLADLEDQYLSLNDELEDKNKLKNDLENDLKSLSKKLKDQQRSRDKLNAAIALIIQKEIEKSKKSKTVRTSNKTAPSKAEIAMSRSFSKQKGRFSWPVNSGVITRRFGKQRHPTLKGVFIKNNGIDIRTEKNAKVKCIHEGRVSSIQYIPGFNQIIIVSHGQYYTVYSNLGSVHVKDGTSVKKGQILGTVQVNKNSNISSLHFELWKGRDHLDPQLWIARKP